jgi:hypothetical protein
LAGQLGILPLVGGFTGLLVLLSGLFDTYCDETEDYRDQGND